MPFLSRAFLRGCISPEQVAFLVRASVRTPADVWRAATCGCMSSRFGGRTDRDSMNQVLAASAKMRRARSARVQKLREVVRRKRFALDVVVGAALMIMIHLFVVQISIVKGHSMEPSLQDGDRLVVDRVSGALGALPMGSVRGDRGEGEKPKNQEFSLDVLSSHV